MKIKDPDIKWEDILRINDSNFNYNNIFFVSGAGSGIGRATAIAAAANCLTVVGVDIDEEAGEMTRQIVEKMDGRMTFIKADLTQDSDIVAAVSEAASMGQIRYLANIAGIQHLDPIEDFPIEMFDRMQRIMIRAPFMLSQLVIPHMTNGGVIGNMASIHAHICTMNKSAYNISKFALRGLTQSIAAEGKGKIRAFSVSTGFVSTPLALNQRKAQAEQRGITEDAVVRDVMMGGSRVKKMMSPIEVANQFIYGFSKHGKYLVGGDLLMDGGVVLTY